MLPDSHAAGRRKRPAYRHAIAKRSFEVLARPVTECVVVVLKRAARDQTAIEGVRPVEFVFQVFWIGTRTMIPLLA